MNPSITDRIEKRIELKAPPASVWRAITDHKEFGQWFRVNLEGPFAPGQTTVGQVTYPGYEHLKFEVIVEKMEAERLFSYRWHPHVMDPNADKTHEPSTLVEFKLEPTAEGTLLILTESGFDSIPAAHRDEAYRRNEGGWTGQMKNIEAHVSKAP